MADQRPCCVGFALMPRPAEGALNRGKPDGPRWASPLGMVEEDEILAEAMKLEQVRDDDHRGAFAGPEEGSDHQGPG